MANGKTNAGYEYVPAAMGLEVCDKCRLCIGPHDRITVLDPGNGVTVHVHRKHARDLFEELDLVPACDVEHVIDDSHVCERECPRVHCQNDGRGHANHPRCNHGRCTHDVCVECHPSCAPPEKQ